MENVYGDGSNSDDSFGWIPLSGKLSERTEEQSDFTADLSCVKEEPGLSIDEELPNQSTESALRANGSGDTFFSNNSSNIKVEHSEDGAILDVDDLSVDDEFWLVQCPIDVNEDMLRGKCFNIGNQKHSVLQPLNVNGQLNVRVRPTSEKISFSCLLPSRNLGSLKLVCLPTAGHMVITETVKGNQAMERPSLPLSSIERNEVHTLPANLRVRHPLLGIDFQKRKIRIKPTPSLYGGSAGGKSKKHKRIKNSERRK